MTGKTSATVEVLTAEVRVLMVGSRQVTLSVFAQLDWVQPCAIEPFGRVAPRDAERGFIYVVGASIAGVLARSRRETRSALVRRADALRHRASLITERRTLDREEHELVRRADYRDRPEHWNRAQAISERMRQIDRALAYETRPAGELIAMSGELLAQAEDAAPWDSLPLIVLAGLR